MAYCPDCKEKVKPKTSYRAKIRGIGVIELWTCPKCDKRSKAHDWKKFQFKHEQMLIDEMKIDLLPCPFCGGKAKFIKSVWVDGGSWSPCYNTPNQVVCTRKKCHANIFGEKLKSTKKWNKRN